MENIELLENDIFDVPLDNEVAKREAQKLLLSEGWYTTDGQQTLRAEVKEDGRRIASFFASIVNNKNPDETGKIGFRMSPDLRYKAGEDKADWLYQMFLSGRKAFIEATGVDPKTEADVIRFLESYPIQLRVVRTKDDSNMVVAFRAVKE